MNQKGLALILIVILLAALVGGYFVWSSYSNNQTKVALTSQASQPSPIPDLDQNLTDSKQTLISLEKSLNVTAPIADRNNINWIDLDKQKIPLTGQDFGLGIEANNYMGKYGNYAQYGDPNFLQDVTEESLRPLRSKIDEFFASNGFQKNNQNTLSDVNLVYLSMGYTKDNLNCLITLRPKSDPIGNFFCGKIDAQQISWRKELTSAINTTNNPNIEVSVTKLVGNYAAGGVGGRGGGAAWFAVKVNGEWKEVWTGQNIISCTPVKQYNIPKEIYGNYCSPNY